LRRQRTDILGITGEFLILVFIEDDDDDDLLFCTAGSD
jgi:hypothetical protein